MNFEEARKHLEAGRIVWDPNLVPHRVLGGSLQWRSSEGLWSYSSGFSWHQVSGEWTLEPLSDEELAKSWEEAADGPSAFVLERTTLLRCARELRARGKL